MSQSNICLECKAFLSDREMKYHPYEYCILAKSFPNNWRDWILRFKKAFDNDSNLSTSHNDDYDSEKDKPSPKVCSHAVLVAGKCIKCDFDTESKPSLNSDVKRNKYLPLRK